MPANDIPTRRRRRRLLLFLLAPAMVVAMLVGGLVWFVASLPRAVADTQTFTDAIVVLTGGSDRVATGFEIFERGLGRRLLISGVGPDTSRADLLEQVRHRADYLACCLVLGRSADDTRGNAAETEAWMRQNGFRSLRLVTAQYHMPRSLLLFRRAMPDVLIVPHPVFPPRVKHEGWWQWPGTTRLLVTEYVKYLGALAAGLVPGLRIAAHAGVT